MSTTKRDEIYNKIDLLNKELYGLNEELKNENLNIIKSCSHDSYIAIDNGDCHKSGYYYTCNKCDYFTKSKPLDKKIIYN